MGRYVKAKRVASASRAAEQRHGLRASARTGQHSPAVAPGEAWCADCDVLRRSNKRLAAMRCGWSEAKRERKTWGMAALPASGASVDTRTGRSRAGCADLDVLRRSIKRLAALRCGWSAAKRKRKTWRMAALCPSDAAVDLGDVGAAVEQALAAMLRAGPVVDLARRWRACSMAALVDQGAAWCGRRSGAKRGCVLTCPRASTGRGGITAAATSIQSLRVAA